MRGLAALLTPCKLLGAAARVGLILAAYLAAKQHFGSCPREGHILLLPSSTLGAP